MRRLPSAWSPSRPVRWATVLASWSAYAFFVYTQNRHEGIVGPLGAFPLVATGLLLGWRIGLAAGLANIPLVMGLHAASGHLEAHGETFLEDLRENAVGLFVGVVVGTGSGVIADTLAKERRQRAALGQREEALRRSEAERTAVLSAIPDLVFVFDADRRFVQFYPGGKGRPYVPPAAFLGKTAPEVLPPTVGPLVDAAVARTVATGETQEIAYTLPSPDGLLHYEARLSPVREGAVVALARDVTARRTAEEEVRRRESLLAQAESIAQMCSWEADVATFQARWSPQAYKLFGLPADSPMTYEAWLACTHPDDRARAKAVADGVLASGQPAEFECRIVRQDDGAVRYTHNLTVPTLADGKVVRLTGINRDVTEVRLAQENVVAKEAETARLREVAAFKTQFLNNAAHELATPLTPIRLQMASLRRSIFGELTPQQLEAVGLLDRNLERLTLLVNDLLDAARLQSGRLQVASRPVRLRPLVEEILASFAAKAKQDGIRIGARGLDSDVEVLGDEPRLTQVLVNLVHNAFKFTPPGGSIDVEVGSSGAEASLAVADTGMGLTEEQIGRLFQPFSQVHDVAKHSVGGTGLGLYICKGIVEQHGGRLECRSAGPGKGCTFEVRLPLPTLVQGPQSAVGARRPGHGGARSP